MNAQQNGPLVLIASRNSIFDPWLGDLKEDLKNKGFSIMHIYCSTSLLESSRYPETLGQRVKFGLKSIINFIGIGMVERKPFLYASDWAGMLAAKVRDSKLGDNFFDWSITKFFYILAIRLYRIIPSRVPLFLTEILDDCTPLPSLVVALPTNMPGSLESEVLSWARSRKIRTFVPVMTLDNLSSKGILLDQPDRVLCWNEKQSQYLQEHHQIPSTKVIKSHSLYFSSWLKNLPGKANRQEAGSGFQFLYVCSSARIGGFRKNPNVRNQETETLLHLIPRLSNFLKAREVAGTLVIRTHPTFHPDPILFSLSFPNLSVKVTKGEFPNYQSENESLTQDLLSARACFGMNTSALLHASLMGVPSYTVVNSGNEIVTTRTPHLRQLLELGIIEEWRVDRDQLSILSDEYSKQNRVRAQEYVGLHESSVVDLIVDFLCHEIHIPRA